MRINLTTPMSGDEERERHTKAVLDAIEQYTEMKMNEADTATPAEIDALLEALEGVAAPPQPVVATQKAHAMVLEVLAEWGIAVRHTTAQQLAVATTEALCRALDQLEDLRQPTQSDDLREALSEAWQEYFEAKAELAELERNRDTTRRFDRALDKQFDAEEKARRTLAALQEQSK